MRKFLLSGTMRVMYFFILTAFLNVVWLSIVHVIVRLFNGHFFAYMNENTYVMWIWFFIVGLPMAVFSMAFVGLMCSRFKKS